MRHLTVRMIPPVNPVMNKRWPAGAHTVKTSAFEFEARKKQQGYKTMNDLQKFEQEQLKQNAEGKKIPVFGPGDTVRVNVRIVEGSGKDAKTRIQAYEGVCIARNGGGIHETFTVRKMSYGEGVERAFPLYAPVIDSIQLVRRGTVRRAKLYYLRDRSGKSARIAERERDATDSAPATDSNKATPEPEKKAAAAG